MVCVIKSEMGPLGSPISIVCPPIMEDFRQVKALSLCCSAPRTNLRLSVQNSVARFIGIELKIATDRVK